MNEWNRRYTSDTYFSCPLSEWINEQATKKCSTNNIDIFQRKLFSPPGKRHQARFIENKHMFEPLTDGQWHNL